MAVSRAELANCAGVEEVVRMIGGKWKLLILRQLVYGGVKRFNALRTDTKGITQTMLTKQLRAMLRSSALPHYVVRPQLHLGYFFYH